ncbi:MAG: PilZ domain-containing protein [Phycisphaerae bacterium]|nr:PilZ domain-containing protein [Phycisphaerae bacterium]
MATKTAQQSQGGLDQVFDGLELDAAMETVTKAEERRQTPRRRIAFPLWVRIISGADAGSAQARQLIDLSPSALGIVSKTPYVQGQQVSVDVCINNITWSGLMRVIHCTEQAAAYRVGLSLSAEPAAVGADLAQLQEQIPKAMRAYRQARISWNLLGTPVKKNIKRIISYLSPVDDDYEGPTQRQYRRAHVTGDVHLIVPIYYGGKWLRAQILDISEGGAGLCVPFSLPNEEIERELAGDFKIAPKMPVIVGIGNEPDTVWLPAEITHCSGPREGAIRVGVEFNTPAAQAAFGA